jgi:cyanophycinase
MWWLWLVACTGRGEFFGDDVSDVAFDSGTAEDSESEASRIRWMLHGGGAEDDEVFSTFVQAGNFGSVVTLGAVEDESDPDLLFWDNYFLKLGTAAARTVNTADLSAAMDPNLREIVADADIVFIRGGDQTRYIEHWFDGPVGEGLVDAWDAGAVIGGSSAGCAILGERIYDARVGSVDAYELLNDARDPSMTFADGAPFGVPGVITDTHFTERGRLARLAVFHAAGILDGIEGELAIGVDTQTALFLRDDQTGFVAGDGAITVLRAGEAAPVLDAGQPPHVPGVRLWSLPAGYEVDLLDDAIVTERPNDMSPPSQDAPALQFAAGRLDGDAAATSRAGTWELTPRDDPYAWVDGALRLVEGLGGLQGATVVGELYDHGELFEAHVGGMLWALTQANGAVVIGVDVGHRVDVSAPASLTPAPDSAVVVIDGRGAAWIADRLDGWQAVAIEDAELSVIGGGRTIDLAR